MMRWRTLPLVLICLTAFVCAAQPQPERRIRIAGFGALSGPVRSFGTNSRAALQAAAERINGAGGVRLADGSTGKFEITYADDHCKPEDGIALVRQAARSDALVAIGPSCSSVAEPLYGALQHKTEDASDGGLQMLVFTDSATKANLARLSEWAFRNSPNESDMYRALWKTVRQRYPDLHTFYGGEEADFAHSHSSWQNIIGKEAEAAGLKPLGSASWSINDSNFTAPAEKIQAANADIVILSSHPITTCGVLKELARRNAHPRLLVGLTSSSTPETLQLCPKEAEGLLIPTSFIVRDDETKQDAAEVAKAGGIADLHCMAGWEILFTLKQVLESSGIVPRPETMAADRRKLRDALAALKEMRGLMGTITRTADRESRKPFVLVQAHQGAWTVVDQAPEGQGSTPVQRILK